MISRALSRRKFLLTASAASLPWPLQLIKPVIAAEADPAIKALFFYVPDGCIPQAWHPAGNETNFTLPAMTEPLNIIKDDLVFLQGLNMYEGGANHEGGIAKLLTANNDRSIDVFLGNQFQGAYPHSSLHLGVATHHQNRSGTMSYLGLNQPVSYEDNPLSAFDRIFSGSVSNEQSAVVELRKKSVLDNAIKDIERLQAALGSTERKKLEQNLSALREVEQRISGALLGECNLGRFNQAGFTINPEDTAPRTWEREEHFKVVGRLQMDQALLALQCGATNVASIMWSHAASPTRILETAVPYQSHDASHYGTVDSEAAQQWITIKRWYMDQFVYLIEQMKSISDGNGTLLDNTIVVLVSELGDSNIHDHNNMPFVIAGKGGGKIETGRFLSYDNEPHSKLWVTIANAMGIPIDNFGYAGRGAGPLTNLLS